MLTPTTRLGTIALACATATALVGCGGGSSDAGGSSSTATLKGKSITFVTFGGKFDTSVKSAYIDPTVAKTGMKIALDSPTDYSKLATQVKTNNIQWQVAMGDPFYAVQNCGKTLAPIDTVVDRTALDPRFVLSKCSVPADQFSYTLMYSKKVYGNNPPTGWADFFDTAKFPGKRGIFSGYVFNGMLEAATLADGVAPADLYPIDIDRAIKKLGTIKSNTNYFDTLAAGQQLMEAGEVSMIVLPQENGLYAAQNGADFAPVWNQQITTWNDYFVPKGANVKEAAPLLNTIASAAGQNAIASLDPVGVSLKSPAKTKASAEVQSWSPLVDDRASKQVIVNQSWWAKNLDAAEAKWTAFVSG